MSEHSVLIIGCGSIGERHLRCFQRTGRTQVTACDANPALLEKVGQTYQVPACSDWEKALTQGGFNAVVICTPAHLHVAMAVRALQRSLHVLIEKPLSQSFEGLDQLFRARSESGRQAAVAYIYHVYPFLIAAREFLARGDFGSVLQGRRNLRTIVHRRGNQKRAAERCPVLTDFVGDPGIHRRPIGGRSRQAKIEAVDLRYRHVALQRGTMLRAAQGAHPGEKLPFARRKVARMIRVGVDIVDFGREESREFGRSELAVARRKVVDVLHGCRNSSGARYRTSWQSRRRRCPQSRVTKSANGGRSRGLHATSASAAILGKAI